MRETELTSQVVTACAALTNGAVAAFPTDTFYALGADALDPLAIARVFELKGRSDGNPLPLLLPSIEMMQIVSRNVPPVALRLAEEFWPGPLTIVIERSENVPAAVTAGGPTVGVRVPDHPVALELLRCVGGPITGTSANPSGTPPTKHAAQVREWFSGDDVVVVDAPCGNQSAPSTVVDLTRRTPTVVRQGSICIDALRELLPDVTLIPQR